MILCRFNDVPEINQPREQFENFLLKSGTGGLYDYWKDISYGNISLDGSKVIGIDYPGEPSRIGWFTMKYSFVNDGNDPFKEHDLPPEKRKAPRLAWINEAKRLANENGIDLSRYQHIMVVVNALVDAGADGENMVLTIAGPWGENNWRWCKNCHCIAHSPFGINSGICARDLARSCTT